MPLDVSKVNQKVSVPSGEIVFTENTPAESLNILHEGGYQIEKSINGKPFPLYRMVGKNLIPGVVSLFQQGRYHHSIKIIQESQVSTYVVNQSTIKKTISSKLSVGIMVAKSLYKEVTELYKKINQLKGLDSSIEQFNDNLSILYYTIFPTGFPDIKIGQPFEPSVNTHGDASLLYTRENLSKFFERGGQLPLPPSKNFFNEKLDSFLSKEYSSEIEFNSPDFQLIRKILSTEPTVHTPLFEADITILISICEQLSQTYVNLFEQLDELITDLHNQFEILFAPNFSYIEKYAILLDSSEIPGSEIKPSYFLPIALHISEICNSFLTKYRSIFLTDFKNLTNVLTDFQEKAQKMLRATGSSPGSSTEDGFDIPSLDSASSDSSSADISVGIDINSVKKELEGSANKILLYAGLDGDKNREMIALVKKFQTMSNPLDTEQDARKIRRNIAKLYWDVYEACFKRYSNNGKKASKPVELMLTYGFFDENLLEDSQLLAIYTSKDTMNKREDFHIYNGTEWLEEIFRKQIPTSLDEMGQTYFEKIKMESKDVLYKKESDVPPEVDTGEKRLNYEMNGMYGVNVRLTSGSPSTHLPILSKYHVLMPLDKCLVTRETVEAALTSILKLDYTAFNREVIFNNNDLGIRNEFVQRSIIPDFIIVPSIGSRVQMWQELSIMRGSGSKESRGRLVIPRFATGDLRTMLMEAVGKFRWELCKSIYGPDWNNVGIPSITSEYTDYIQFFKKSKDLSIEVKEKLVSEFKRFRNDHDKFINDYILWLKYESEGVPRLNRVVRTIFYRHIPFEKETRDKVSKLPAFSEIHNKFTNIRNRQFKEVETKYKKYLTTGMALPAPMQENLDFYKV